MITVRAILEVDSLSGGYHPRKAIIKNLNFSLHQGQLIGLIGLNGAGKSTTIKHILGLMKPHQGKVLIHGKTIDEDSEAYRSSYAYVPESPVLYEEMTVEDHLKMIGMAYNVPKEAYEVEVERLLKLYRMDVKRNMLTSHLSKGMKQKVMIMSALLAKPDLLIVDEPFLGLDPLGIRSLLEQLQDVKKMGSAILMSSHILGTVEQYCDGIIMLEQGEVIASGTVAEVTALASKRFNQSVETLEDAFYLFVSEGEHHAF